MNASRFAFSLLILLCWQPTPAATAAEITRSIDASRYFRKFPDLVGYRNTSIQKAPAPALAGLAARDLGKAKVTRCWVNLDELWDYRTGKFTHNYPIGVHKYDDVKEKFRESWNWVTPTNVRSDDYLKAFGEHSDEILLCVRRYERDILDGKLGVTPDDWKAAFKHAVKHSKQVCPNVRYIEVCNEYGCSGFCGCTPDEYYSFYRLAYQAVNEVNAELKLTGKNRLLVGGPNVVRDAMTALNFFFENYAKDDSAEKRLDFVTWHEYHNRYAELAHREEQVKGMLRIRHLPEDLPMFITEHDPYHPKAGAREYNLINGAGLVKSLYFTNVYSPNVKIMPWVLYHDGDIQTRFMWYAGPNEPKTKAEELRMLPAGCSMKLLSMHADWEIAVDNSLARNDLVLASVQNDSLIVEAVNYDQPRPVNLRIDHLAQVFSALGDGEVTVEKYLIDQTHSNGVTNPEYPGGIERIDECRRLPKDGSLTLEQTQLAQHAIVCWKLTPTKIGPALNSPVKLDPPVEQTDSTAFDPQQAFATAAATPDAVVRPAGKAIRVDVKKSNDRPGVVFSPADGLWDVRGMESIEVRVKNTGKRPLNVHLVVENPNANRTEREGCVIRSVTISPAAEKLLQVALGAQPTGLLKTAFRGMRGTPGGFQTREGRGIDPTKVAKISVYVYHPGGDFTYEVSDLRTGTASAFPLPTDLGELFPMIDRFGQYIHKDWPGKIHTESELLEQRKHEADDLAQHAGPKDWNKYGGWLGGPQLEATGRFRVAKWNDKWWLIDPEGRLFWSHGLVRVTWSCGYTPITGRRFLFADLPPGNDSPFSPFYGHSTWAVRGLYERGAETYNFSGANLLRKYGEHWPTVYADVTHRRFRSWGLNTLANCSQPAIYLQRKTPYTATVYSLASPPEDTPGGTGYVATIHVGGRVIEAASGGWGKFPDVFDPSFKDILKQEVALHKGKSVGDPWCLGYFLGNELTWGHSDTWLAAAVLKSPAGQAAKRVLVSDLRTKYETIDQLNAAWGSNYSSWEALLQSTTPPDEKRAHADLSAFLDKTADAYFRQCREAVKEVDPEGLYLGCRFAGWANERIFLAAAKYSDVISVNRYAESLDDLRLPGGIDKPVIIGEFHFGALDRGKFHATLRPVADQQARGAAYEKYVRSALENPLVVGTHWHQFGDQATTGRDDGENFQNGFVDVCDTPYAETIAACRRIGYPLYEVRTGR